MSGAARDYQAKSSEIGEVESFDEHTLRMARRTVASNALGAQDAAELMMMLGIHPAQRHDANPTTQAAKELSPLQPHIPAHIPHSVTLADGFNMASFPQNSTPPRRLNDPKGR